MNARGSTNVMLLVLLQLVFAGILLFALMSFFATAFSEETFYAQVYASDNALIAEALQTETVGTMQLLYLFPNTYHTAIQPTIVQAGPRAQGGSVRRFSVREDIETMDAQLESRLIRWQRSPDTLIAAQLSLADGCPPIQTLPNLQVIEYGGDHDFVRSLKIIDALVSFTAPGRFVSVQSTTNPRAPVYVEVNRASSARIERGEGALAARLACFLAQEISVVTGDDVDIRVDLTLGEDHLVIELGNIQDPRILRLAFTNAIQRTVRTIG